MKQLEELAEMWPRVEEIHVEILGPEPVEEHSDEPVEEHPDELEGQAKMLGEQVVVKEETVS